MMEWLNMGGYALYVWSSYGIFLIILGVNIVSARRGHRAAQRAARRRLERNGT